jgi:hypothetical protein
MSKELMEIGGFITEGAEIVNHDNSLSGNGTVDSPLGVVPGWTDVSDQFEFTSSITGNRFKLISYSPVLNLVILNIGFNCTSTSSVNAITGPTRFFPKDRLEIQNASNGRFIDINRAYDPNFIQVRAGTAGWTTINIIYQPYGS